jgi:uncharacterized membrane protein YraQ (UPF0718 family)
MRPEITTIVLAVLAIALGVVAYLRDPGLPWIGARNGLAMLWFVLPGLVPGLILGGMLQVLVPQEGVSRWRFVVVRVIPSLMFPVLAGWLVKVFYQE